MKKLLSLLNVLTINGTAIPSIITVSHYQKEEKIGNINYKIQTQSNDKNDKMNIIKIVIKTNSGVYTSGIILNNKLYFGSLDNNVYEYDPVTKQQKVVITKGSQILSSCVVLNNKLYFGSWDNNVYECDPNYYNLEQINNNFYSVILNELNYLNPELDISQLKIINKTNNSAIVK